MQTAFAFFILFAALLLNWQGIGAKSDSRCSVDPWGCASEQTGEQTEGRSSVDPWGVTGD
jgi:hypothetical protein